MKEIRSAFSPLDWEQGKNDGQFVRVRIASSAEIIPQEWQTKTEISPPLLFLSSETWLCDWSDGDFEEGKFSIDDNGAGENYTLTLKFRSRVAPIDFQTWYNLTLRKQQVCLELHDNNNNERVFNPFDVSYKVNQQHINGDMTEYELTFVRSKLIEQKDRIIAASINCENNVIKFVFANKKPELYDIAVVSNESETPVFFDAIAGISGKADGKYIGYARRKSNLEEPFLKFEFEVKCNASTLEVLEIEEIFESNLKIFEIEEITDLTEKEAIIIGGNINSIDEVCTASNANGRIEGAVYFYDNPRLGMTLFKDKAKKQSFDSGFYALKFAEKTYKIQTNAQGIVTNFAGECNYSTITDKRFIAYQPLNEWDVVGNLPLIKTQIDEMVNEAGVNFIALTIQLSYVFQSWSMLNSNTSPAWEKYDELVQHVKSKNLPVGIRVHLAVDDNYVPNFYGFDNSEMDEWGKEQRVYYGDNLTSLAYQPGVNMIQTFLRKVMDRYYPVLGANLYYVSPTIAATMEMGGNMINRQYPEPEYFALYDYNPLNIAEFRNRMQQKYGTMQNLKLEWGNVSLAWNNWSDIQPPRTGLSNRFSSSIEAIRGMFWEKRGHDWWQYCYSKKKEFFIQCRDIIKEYNSNILVVAEFGSCNDVSSVMRLSYNVPDLCTFADVVKSDFSSMTVNPVGPSISADWINSLSTKPKWSEIASFDAGNPDTAKEYIRLAFENNLVYASFILMKDANKINDWNAYKQIIKQFSDEYKNKDISAINWQGSISTTLSECISNWPAVEQRYRDAGGSSSKRVKINFTNDL